MVPYPIVLCCSNVLCSHIAPYCDPMHCSALHLIADIHAVQFTPHLWCFLQLWVSLMGGRAEEGGRVVYVQLIRLEQKELLGSLERTERQKEGGRWDWKRC